jgi:hypothetical protein
MIPLSFTLPLTPHVAPHVDLIKNALVWCLAFFLKLIQGRWNPWQHD